MKGHSQSNTGKTHFKKGRTSWNKGKVGLRGTNHGLWKGDLAHYATKHKWVERWLGKPNKCNHCNTTVAKRFEWHNISGLYLRELEDWERLCSQCHGKTRRKVMA